MGLVQSYNFGTNPKFKIYFNCLSSNNLAIIIVFLHKNNTLASSIL